MTGPLAYLVVWYTEVRAQAQRGMRVEPVQLAEIWAYGQLHELHMEPWEADLMCRLDRLWLQSLPKDGESPSSKR